MVVIIDIGLGNINSVNRALNYLDIRNSISTNISDVENADRLILPGVGNFYEASNRLYSTGIADVLRHQVLDKKKAILGICLGMQLFAETSQEGGFCKGLGLIKARVSRLRSEGMGFRLPHIGWNDISFNNMPLFSGIENKSCFYFAHSYEMITEEELECAVCNYGVNFVAAVKKENILGVQFHPEKSQHVGLRLLKNFVEGIY